MTHKIEPPQLYLAEVSEKLGLGSFSAKAFSRKEIVETSPVVVLTGKYKDFPIEIKHRVFNWGRLSQTKPDTSLALAQGYGSYYNHSDTPNLMYKADSTSMTIQFIARKDIAPNERFTITKIPMAHSPLPKKTTWFKNKKIEQTNV
jgi:SET domain-containing protein